MNWAKRKKYTWREDWEDSWRRGYLGIAEGRQIRVLTVPEEVATPGEFAE